ncbi:hypothetical protein [Dyella acidisoli]|uniref:hypothetical protein n=1 Tax=Dyella acidisoli TaxID=1867834 RepID=UPI0024E08861|nr:hypothetical protein [Dyella acidisoli]
MSKLMKRICAFLLAISFFLPLAQCSQKMEDASPPLAVSASNAYEWPSLFSTVLLLLFFWPLALVLWRAVMRRAPSRRVCWIECGLSGATLVAICWLVLSWRLSFGASIRYGAFVACGSILGYGAMSLMEGIRGETKHAADTGGADPDGR